MWNPVPLTVKPTDCAKRIRPNQRHIDSSKAGSPERKPGASQGNEMDYYEKLQDRADNKRERTERDEDFAFEQRRQRDLDNAAAFYETAVMMEQFERRAA